MRKIIALFLALTLLCSMAGCKKNQATTPTDPATMNTHEVLLYQAHIMAQQLGMVAGSNYLKSIGLNDKTFSLSKPFTMAANQLPFKVSYTRNITPDFITKVYAAINQYSNDAFVTAASILSYECQISLDSPLTEAVSVILEYDPMCNVLVHYQPLEGNLVSAQIVPLPSSALEPLLKQYFKNAKEYGTSYFAGKEAVIASISLQAPVTGATTNAAYYSQLAKDLVAQCSPLTESQLAQLTTNQQVIAQVLAFSKVMSGEILSTHVYNISTYASSQAANVLGQDVYAQQLKDYVATSMALATPNLLSSKYDTNVMQANAILMSSMKITAHGAAASEDEAAVIVLLELTGDTTLVLALCPDAYNLYRYAFACIPAPVDHVKTMLDAIQATPIQ